MKEVLTSIIKANEDLLNNRITDEAYDAFLDEIEQKHHLKIRNGGGYTTSLKDIKVATQFYDIDERDIPDIIITIDNAVDTAAKLPDFIINDDKLLAYHLNKDTEISCDMHVTTTLLSLWACLLIKKLKIVDSVSAIVNNSYRSFIINVLYVKGANND